ncbi:MAG: hypothetical protein ACI9K2_006965, partial [Myxococcota bacterium]
MDRRIAGLAGGALVTTAVAWLMSSGPVYVPHTEAAPDAIAAADAVAREVAVLDDGSFLFLAVEPIDDDGSLRLDATATLDVSENEGQSVVFALDVSNSTLDPGEGCGADFNDDGLVDTILDCELASVLTTIEALEAAEADEVGVALFFATGATADVQPADGLQTFTLPGADRDGDGERDLETVLRNTEKLEPYAAGADEFSYITVRQTPLLVGVGQTWFSAGLEAGCAAMGSSVRPRHTLVFLADGEATHGEHVSTQLPCAVPTVVHAVAVGAEASCEADGAGRGSLQDIADLGGGGCTHVADPADLSAVLTDVLLPQVTAVTVAVDGGAPVDVSADLDTPLPARGPVTLALSHVVEGLADGPHTVCVTVQSTVGAVEDCVVWPLSAPPVADAGDDQALVEGDLVFLDGSGSSDPNGDGLGYRWSVDAVAGQPLVLPASVSATTAVRPVDEGTYTLALTVLDGQYEATDAVQLTVANAPPVLGRVEAAVDGRLALLSVAVTDPGLLDTHTATVDWGDGSAPAALDPTVQGGGWAAFTVGHALPPGEWIATVTVVDDAGDSVAVEVPLTVDTAPAIWATGADDAALSWIGAGITVAGEVASAGGLVVDGPGAVIAGPATHAGPLVLADDAVVDPAPARGAPGPSPLAVDLAAYAPDGPIAASVADYHNHSSECVDGVWSPDAPLPDGVHYAACDADIDAAWLAGIGRPVHGHEVACPDGGVLPSGFDPTDLRWRHDRREWPCDGVPHPHHAELDDPEVLADAVRAELTVVVDGALTVHGAGAVADAYIDGVLFAAGEDLVLAADRSDLVGWLAAPTGIVEVAGDDSRLACGLTGAQVVLSGDRTTLAASECLPIDAALLPPLVVPALAVTLDPANTVLP